MSNAILSNISQKFYVVVPAAGVGKRMLASCPKQYLMLNNQTILSHTVNRLLSHKNISKVVLAVSDEDEYFSLSELSYNPRVIRVSGGNERVDSVLNGLQEIDEDAWVLVHDAARPCVTHNDIDKLMAQCIEYNSGGILAAPVTDTIKCAQKKDTLHANRVVETIDRSSLWHAFTPQMFKVKTLKKAIVQAQQNSILLTDEASAIEYMGLPCLLVSGRTDNIKITRPEDLILANFYLDQQKNEHNKG